MRVLHVISGIDPSAGGTATALGALAPAQKRAGLDVSILATCESPSLEAAKHLRDSGIDVTEIGPVKWPLARHPGIVPALQAKILDADVVHIHALWEDVQHQAARLSRELGVPYVISPHGMLDPWSLSQSRYRKAIYLAVRMRRDLNYAAAIHYTSNPERDLAEPLKLKAPAIVVSNGVNLAEFENLPAKFAFRRRYGLNAKKKILLFLGRLHYKKGLELLIPAVAKLNDPNTYLAIVGPDNEHYVPKLQKLVAAHGLTDRVIFTGMLRGPRRIEAFVDADLFVLPSYQENFGIAVVESLAAGCPVVISDQVNIFNEIRQAGVGGVTTTQVDPLTAEVKRWLDNPELRRAAAERAPAFVRSHYDWNPIALQWVEHYSRVVGAQKALFPESAPTEPIRIAPGHGKLRVLHVISNLDPESGGPAMALAGLVRAQRRVGLEVDILSTFPRNAKMNLAHELRRQGKNIRLIGPGYGKLIRHEDITPTLREMIARADVVHIHGLWEEVLHQAAIEADRAELPYFIRTCGMLDPWSLAQHRVRKRAYLLWRLRNNLNNATGIHCTSEVESELIAPLKLKAPRIVEPNGIDISEFSDLPTAGSFRKRYPELQDRPMVLFLGRIHYKKGLDLLIPAFARGTSGEVMLVVAGPDADGYRAKIERLVASHGLQDRVIFPGMLYGRERIEALTDADLFVLPSYQENFGIAVVESLAAGTPVLVSDQVNIHTKITQGKVGVVVPTQIEPIATALTRWMGDTKLRAAAAARAYVFVRDNYDWQAIATRWAERYTRIRDRRKSPTNAPVVVENN